MALYLLHGDGGGYGRGKFGAASALHQLDGVLHLQLVVEGDELRLLGALARDQALLHILFVKAIQPAKENEKGRPKLVNGQPPIGMHAKGIQSILTCPSSDDVRNVHRCLQCRSGGGQGTASQETQTDA